MEVELFTIELREITGQKLGIWPSMRSRCKFFWKAVSRRVVGTSSPSGLSPILGAVEDFFSHVKLSAKNGAKLASRERKYCRFCLQASNVVMLSFFVMDHRFRALIRIHDVIVRVHSIDHRIGRLVVAWINETVFRLSETWVTSCCHHANFEETGTSQRRNSNGININEIARTTRLMR